MTLAELMATETENPFWLRCDIDGHGKRWRLARFCEMEDEEDPRGVQILSDDAAERDHFEDWAANYEDAEAVEIMPPLDCGPTYVLKIRNWTGEGDICTIVCTCGGMATMEADVKRPIPPYTTAKCERTTCGKRWRLESVNALMEAECREVTQ
jgi:hypothetical protein